jgi:hypothetical protein
MKITIKETTVVVEFDSAELATVDCALGSFLQLAASPRNGHPMDHADPTDVERANAMEQELFKAWCQLEEKANPEELVMYQGQSPIV